jgi:hypothetical protein
MEMQQALIDDVIAARCLNNKVPTLFIRYINESVKMDNPVSVV